MLVNLACLTCCIITTSEHPRTCHSMNGHTKASGQVQVGYFESGLPEVSTLAALMDQRLGDGTHTPRALSIKAGRPELLI